MKALRAIIFVGFFSFMVQAEERFIELFNGKDLTGWSGEGYAVKDGVIVCTPKGKNLTSKKQYSNYVLDFEFKLPPGGNNGLGVHYTGEGDPAYTGLELQILDDTAAKYAKLKESQYHGGLYKLQPAKHGHLNPVGEWNKQRVVVNGNQLTIELNGVVINDANLDQLAKDFPDHTGVKRRAGYIAFCGHGDPVAFRNIKIMETVLPEIDLNGYHQMYDKKSLAGWSKDPGHIDHWQPRGEVLYYDSKSTAADKNLWTQKSYKNFTMVFDWRWPEISTEKKNRPVLDPTTGEVKKDSNGKPILKNVIELDSGIYLRGNNRSQVNLWNWPCGSGEVYGYRNNLKFSQKIRAALTPTEPADYPIGAWNRMMITLNGDRLTVTLNGIKVINKSQLPGIPEEGPIALQHHGSALEFRNLYIKEL